jgi:hypothetical protein
VAPTNGHDAVPQVLHDPTVVRLHGAAHQPIVVPPDLLGPVLTQIRAQLGRAHHVGEQHDGG